MFWKVDKAHVDVTATLAVLQQFGTRDSHVNGKKLFFRVLTNSEGFHSLETVTQDQLSWFNKSNLSRVCEVATEALRADRGHACQARHGIEKLQKRVIHYALKVGTTPEMVAFLQAADRCLHPTSGIVGRVFKALKGCAWPFGEVGPVSPSTLLYSPRAQVSGQPPNVRQKQRGSVLLEKLCSIQNMWSLCTQKIAMWDKILQGKTDNGSLDYVQFTAPSSETLLNTAAEVGQRPMVVKSHKRVYDYRADSTAFTCTVNFADHRLFGFWKGSLFAQDELQVLEHPDLGRLEHFLSSWSLTGPRTESLSGTPSPWLIKGVKRHGVVRGLYGNALVQLNQQAAASYVSRIADPKESNILAMAAINHGYGSRGRTYCFSHILKQFLAAYTAFKGAKQEAISLGKSLTVQTGNWGAGAFGNDPELMAIIQILAARFAGVDRLDYYTCDRTGQRAFNRAQRFIQKLDDLHTLGTTPTLGSILRILYQANFVIGQSNGT